MDHLLHLGGRYFLSTKKQTINLNNHPFKMSSMGIYQIPCNHTSDQLPTGFGTCPAHLTMNLPIFRRNNIRYVPWTPTDYNNNTINLHYKSLNIPPPLELNKTVINALDKTFHRLDGHLADKLKTIRADVDNIHEVSNTPLAIAIASIALVFSAVNLLTFIVLCCYHRRRRLNQPDLNLVHYVKTPTPQNRPLPTPPTPEHEHFPMTTICPDCGEEEDSISE